MTCIWSTHRSDCMPVTECIVVQTPNAEEMISGLEEYQSKAAAKQKLVSIFPKGFSFHVRSWALQQYATWFRTLSSCHHHCQVPPCRSGLESSHWENGIKCVTCQEGPSDSLWQEKIAFLCNYIPGPFSTLRCRSKMPPPHHVSPPSLKYLSICMEPLLPQNHKYCLKSCWKH